MTQPPRQLVLETSAICNLKCPQCWTGLQWLDRTKHIMSMDLFSKIADEAKDFISYTYLHLWGEPTLNRNLKEMIRRTKEFSRINLATHGLYLSEAMAESVALCDDIYVSIDGITQETYEQYRVGGQLDKALEGLKLLVKLAGSRVVWTYVVFKHNEHEIPQAAKIAEEIGVKIGFKPPLFWDKSKMDSGMPTEEKYRRYQLINGEWQLKVDRLKCKEFWETMYVLPNADVITCCYDGAAEYVVGNVRDRSLLDVWNGDQYNQMREQHLAGHLNELCKKYCHLQ